MGRSVLLIAMLASCASWFQTEPPPREAWHEPGNRCHPNSPAPIGAAIAVALNVGLAVTMFATSSSDEQDNVQHTWGAIFAIAAGGYALDGLNTLSDRSKCRKYRAGLADIAAPLPMHRVQRGQLYPYQPQPQQAYPQQQPYPQQQQQQQQQQQPYPTQPQPYPPQPQPTQPQPYPPQSQPTPQQPQQPTQPEQPKQP